MFGQAPQPLGTLDGTVARATLERARIQLSRTGDRFRVATVAAFWGLHLWLGVLQGESDWQGNLHLWSVYLVVSVVVLVASHRSIRFAARSVGLVVFLDMPMLFWLQSILAPRGDPPDGTVGFTAGGFVLLVVWTAMALEPRLTWLAAVAAGLFEGGLFKLIGGSDSAVMVSLLLMISAGFLTNFVTKRLGGAMLELAEARARRDASEASMAEKDRFISTVSHDFRTPLAVIIAAIQTVTGDPEMPPATRADFLKRGLRQGKRLLAMTEDLLRLAKLGARPPQVERVDLVSLTRSTVEPLVDRAEARGVTLRFVDSVDRATVDADSALVERALTNLLDNALRLTRPGGQVRAWVRRGPSGQGFRVGIEDEGPGVPADLRARVFEPFERGEGEGSEGGGTGLGLAVVREVARVHGGDALLERTSDQGSCFVIAFEAAEKV